MNNRQKKASKIFWSFGLLLYMIIIFYFVLFSEHYGRQLGYTDYQYNLTPFKEIHRFIAYRTSLSLEGYITNLFGNIFAFSPYGAILPLARRKKTGLFMVLFSTLCFSLSIEIMQLVFKIGVFDVDDLMLNTLGGLIGYLCYLIYRRVFHVS